MYARKRIIPQTRIIRTTKFDKNKNQRQNQTVLKSTQVWNDTRPQFVQKNHRWKPNRNLNWKSTIGFRRCRIILSTIPSFRGDHF